MDEQLADVCVDNPGLGPERCQRRPGQACYYELNEAMTSCLKSKEVVYGCTAEEQRPKNALCARRVPVGWSGRSRQCCEEIETFPVR